MVAPYPDDAPLASKLLDSIQDVAVFDSHLREWPVDNISVEHQIAVLGKVPQEFTEEIPAEVTRTDMQVTDNDRFHVMLDWNMEFDYALWQHC